MFCLETFILDYREKTRNENLQLFDRIINITLFVGVEGLFFLFCVPMNSSNAGRYLGLEKAYSFRFHSGIQ